MDTWQALLLAIVEGLTEYLPVSSTGHIILTSFVLGINEQSFVKDYTVMVQFGAILAVVVLYGKRFFRSWDFYKKLALAFFPAAGIGLLVKSHIDRILGSMQVVAWALAVGGFILVILDRKKHHEKNENKTLETKIVGAKIASKAGAMLSFSDEVKFVEESLSYKQAFVIGLIQCLAFIPGVSRSAATIMGGLFQGLKRKDAAEFSFLLAVPTLTGATFIKVLKIIPSVTQEQIGILITGNVVSFIVGFWAVRWFVSYLSRFGLAPFGWYRMVLGGLFLILSFMGFL